MGTSNPQRMIVLTELLRRGGALVLFIAGATIGLGYGRADLALAAIVAGGLVYALPPRPKPPQGAVYHERMPTVFMPDLLGFMLATTFFTLPLIVAVNQPSLGQSPWFFAMFWTPGAVALLIFWIAARHQCLWLRVLGHELTLADMHGIVTLPFSEIARVRAETRPPPRWLKPLLVLFGGWRGFGIALLTAERPSHALIVEKRDGSHLRIPADAFPDVRGVLAVLNRNDVALDASLKAQVERKRHPRPVATAKAGLTTGQRHKRT